MRKHWEKSRLQRGTDSPRQHFTAVYVRNSPDSQGELNWGLLIKLKTRTLAVLRWSISTNLSPSSFTRVVEDLDWPVLVTLSVSVIFPNNPELRMTGYTLSTPHGQFLIFTLLWNRVAFACVDPGWDNYRISSPWNYYCQTINTTPTANSY